MNTTNRPFVTINAAMTADGKIDTILRRGATISSSADKLRVDQLRAKSDAVMVGGRTLINEDPKLTVKSPELRSKRLSQGLQENPAKIGIVSIARMNPNGEFVTAGPARSIIYTTRLTDDEQAELLKSHGVEVYVLGEHRVDLPGALEHLHSLGIRKLMVEGGGTLIAEFFRLGLVDELFLFIAPMIFGGVSAPTLADGTGFEIENAIQLKLVDVESMGEGGIVTHYTLA